MLDINGQPLRAGDTASLLCEILSADEDGVRVRVMNSDTEYIVGVKHDEVLGGLVADSELTLFEPSDNQPSAVSPQPSAPPDLLDDPEVQQILLQNGVLSPTEIRHGHGIGPLAPISTNAIAGEKGLRGVKG